MRTRRGWLRLSAAAALLALLGGGAPAHADDVPRGKYGVRSCVGDVMDALNGAEALVRGRITSRESLPGGKLGLPGTYYTIKDAEWLRTRPKVKQTKAFQFFVPGGLDVGRGLYLYVSRGGFNLKKGEEYAILADSTDAGFTATTVLREVPEKSTHRKVVIDATGHAIGVDTASIIRRALAQTEGPIEVTGRRCDQVGKRHRYLPVGEKGLRAFRLFPPGGNDPDWPSLMGLTLEELLAFLETGQLPAAITPGDPYNECFSCAVSSTGPSPMPWLPGTIGYHAHPTLSTRHRELVDSCFRAWNHVTRRPATGGSSLVEWAGDEAAGGLHPAFAQDGKSGIAFVLPGDLPSSSNYHLVSSSSAWKGLCFLWVDPDTGRFVEADILINAAHISADEEGEQDFLRTVTHELGHAVTLGHECGYVSILTAGTQAYVPEGASGTIPDFVRGGDFRCTRKILRESNGHTPSPNWQIPSFRDMGTVAAYAIKSGTNCVPALTYIDGFRTEAEVTAAPGEVLDVVGVHLENRGLRAACAPILTFRLVRGRTKRVVGRYHFLGQFSGQLAARYQIRIPWRASGEYVLAWEITHDQRDKAPGNATSWLTTAMITGNPQVLLKIRIVP